MAGLLETIFGALSGASGGKENEGLGALAGVSEAKASETGAGPAKESGLLTGAKGALAGINDWRDGKKFDGGMGVFKGLMGLGGGIADLIGAKATASGNKETARKSGLASGILGLLGGAGSVVSGVKTLFTADNSKDRWGGALGALSGLVGTAGGITGLISGQRQAKGQSTDKVDKASGWLGMIGNMLGGVTSLFNPSGEDKAAGASGGS